MTKKRNKKKTSHPPERPSRRNPRLDCLRGLAIFLMIVDHVAGMLLHIDIEPTSIRLATRLSMPLFSILMGFLLAARTTVNWNRFFQLVLATAAINLLFFEAYRQVEILASLFVCYSVFLVLRKFFAVLFVAAFFFQFDPSVSLFDFPLSLVATCVAQGVILQVYGWRVAAVTGALTLLGLAFVAPPSVYLLYFLLPATLLVAWAAHSGLANRGDQLGSGRSPPSWLKWLEVTGRYPLTVYLTQYFILFAIRAALRT
ncbi:MAG: heparan-alpha-glucosaminide N-acetyltransferase domain-containing protein [Pirellulaceae bacterium]